MNRKQHKIKLENIEIEKFHCFLQICFYKVISGHIYHLVLYLSILLSNQRRVQMRPVRILKVEYLLICV